MRTVFANAIALACLSCCAHALATAPASGATTVAHGVSVTALYSPAPDGLREVPIEVRADGAPIATLHGMWASMTAVSRDDTDAKLVLVAGESLPPTSCSADAAVMFFVHPDRRISDTRKIDSCTTRINLAQKDGQVTLKLWPKHAPKDSAPAETLVWNNGVRQ